MQAGAKEYAFKTPVQGFTGCGAFQRRSATGGAANGMPLKEATPLDTEPFISPPVIFVSRICVTAVCVAANNMSMNSGTESSMFLMGLFHFLDMQSRRGRVPISCVNLRCTAKVLSPC